jgi:hypothetical protein
MLITVALGILTLVIGLGVLRLMTMENWRESIGWSLMALLMLLAMWDSEYWYQKAQAWQKSYLCDIERMRSRLLLQQQKWSVQFANFGSGGCRFHVEEGPADQRTVFQGRGDTVSLHIDGCENALAGEAKAFSASPALFCPEFLAIHLQLRACPQLNISTEESLNYQNETDPTPFHWYCGRFGLVILNAHPSEGASLPVKAGTSL